MPRITVEERARFHARLDECIDKMNTEKNAAKPHWSTQSSDDLFDHLESEIGELDCELFLGKMQDNSEKIGDECKDVVNIALMIFDNTRGNR